MALPWFFILTNASILVLVRNASYRLRKGTIDNYLANIYGNYFFGLNAVLYQKQISLTFAYIMECKLIINIYVERFINILAANCAIAN